MRLLAALLVGLPLGLALARPDRATEILAVWLPAGPGVWLLARRLGRRLAADLAPLDRDLARLRAHNRALAARLDHLRRERCGG